jgi:hypothetical protein
MTRGVLLCLCSVFAKLAATKTYLLMAAGFFFTLAGYSQTVVVDWDHSISNF